MKKLIAILLTLMTCLSTMIVTPALAESVKFKSTGSTSYTIQTKKKEATLTFSPSTGKRAQDFVHKNSGKKKTVSQAVYGSYTVKVDGKKYTVSKSTVTVKLSANSTHHVSIQYEKPCQPYMLIYSGTFTKPAWEWKQSGSEYWKTNPSVKIKVNNWASID